LRKNDLLLTPRAVLDFLDKNNLKTVTWSEISAPEMAMLEFDIMKKTKGFLKNIYTPFLFIALILSLSFSIRSGFCAELQTNKALDEKVRIIIAKLKASSK
jgi:hypothetical protein